jgi:hypothetical protein
MSSEETPKDFSVSLNALSSRAQRGICFSPSPSVVDQMPPRFQLVQQERRFYFIRRADRCVLFSVLATSLDDAHQKFLASGHTSSDALLIIQTETQIYLA